MKWDDIPSQAQGLRYDDPSWDLAEVKASAKHGVPVEVLRTIRTVGEKSHDWQVSPKGARGVYQFTPTSRNLFKTKYGVDAYGDTADEQAEAAALHLKESYKRTGDWKKAMAGFNGGISGEKGTNTTDENVAYAARTGAALGNAGDPPAPAVVGRTGMRWEDIPDAPEETTAEQPGPGHAAIIRKMDNENAPPVPSIPGQATAGATRYFTGRVLPAVEDFVRGRVGSQPGSLDPFTKQPQSYLSQPIMDWGEKNYKENKGLAADLGESIAAGLGGLVGPSGQGKANAAIKFLRTVGSAVGQELALTPQPGDTRTGNAAQAGIGAGIFHTVAAPLGKVADWTARKLRGTSGLERKAGEQVTKAGGGQSEIGQALDDLADSQSGVVMSPASRMDIPKLGALETKERRLNPRSFQSLDDSTARSADTIRGAADDKLFNITNPSPMETAAHRRIISGVERDVAKTETLKGSPDSLAHTFTEAMKTANRILENKGVGTVAGITGHGKGLNVARGATRILGYLKLAPKGNVELANALADPSGDALRRLVDKYGQSLNDETKAQIVQNLASRQAAAMTSTARNNDAKR